ncbi:MAG: OmpA family protein [Pseudomonadota bacterium]
MVTFAIVSLTISMVLLFGFPAPKSTIILLPDADGTVGEVSVTNKTGSQLLTTAYTAIEVKDAQSELKNAIKIDQKQIENDFKATLSAQPDQLRNYILYFISGGSELTPESQQKIPEIVADIRKRSIYEAFIIGHTDTKGKNDLNYNLGLNRAKTVGKIIDSHFPDTHHIEILSYGEGSLLVPTADNVSESKNRRVEIEIH